ncbi:hypothetical protein [Sphingomonas sp. PR090111-T3T-6A]|uniref:hypothetical protein n=1 Tax=Sphingomonas sp. PR090111-T3T-6A TaxID=685778 RepID=UPI000364B461|nr:hypothetical protein [Sphingomonas sp. PR090111-T3T-6A]
MTALLAWITAHLLPIALSAIPGVGGIAALVVRGINPIAWLDQHRSYITFIVLAIVAAGLWAWAASIRADRDGLLAWGDAVCASAGAQLDPPNGKRGEACRARVADLARYEHDTTAESAQILAQAAKDREEKAARDADRARATAADTRAAAEAMEKANGSIGSDDRVGGDWFAALNRVGGLRAPAR